MLSRLIPAFVVAAALLPAAPVAASPYSALYVFGDSLSDAGNVYIGTHGTEPVSPPYYPGVFSNGPVWAQDLALSLGMPPLTASLAGGTDFAYGGAQTGTTPLHTANPTDLPAQLTQFKAAIPKPAPNALYTLWIGSNDLFAALTALGTGTLTKAGATTDLAAAVSNMDHFVAGLAADGAKNLLVLTVPDLGVTPAIRAEGTLAMHTASALAASFDTAMVASLNGIAQADQLNLHVLDTYSLLDAAVANSASFGFSNVTAPCWTGSLTSASSGTLCASTTAAQNKYLFWDGVHPTAAGQLLVAQAAENAVPEPGSLALLASALVALAALRPITAGFRFAPSAGRRRRDAGRAA
jgi:phospholipase/lecithinase/hemolysin